MIALLMVTGGCAKAPPVQLGGCGSRPGVVRGSLVSIDLNEVSGVVASRRHEGVYWVHNDSGGSARVFAVGAAGEHLGATALAGARAVDWEDIALLPGDSHDWLLLADTGDNREVRTNVTVYRIAEPTPGAPSAPSEAMLVRYPDGSHNAEVLLVDPMDQTLFLLTKNKQGPSILYALGPFQAGPVTARRVLELEFPAGNDLATAGDARGSNLAIRTYTHVHLYPASQGIEAALRQPACSIGWPEEPQGEAITFVDGGLLSISEGVGEPLNFVALP